MDDNFIVHLTSSLEEYGKMLQQTCSQIFSQNDFVDCTLVCSDGQVPVHRVVLASASSSMYSLLSSTPWPTPCSHPVLFFKSFTMEDMKLAMEFIYTGKAQVSKDKLPKLMNISRELGCTSLSKAIEKAIQSCGVEIFRRRINQNQSNMKSIPTQSVTQTPTSSYLQHEDAGTKTSQSESNILKANESEDNQLLLTSDDIKVELEEMEENNANATSPSTSIPSILKTTPKPPPPLLKRAMSDVVPTLANYGKVQRTEEVTMTYKTPENQGSFMGNNARQWENHRSLNPNETSSSMFYDEGTEDGSGMLPGNGEDDDGNDSVIIEDDQTEDGEEMPITVIDLKSLAEPEVSTSQIVNFAGAEDKSEVLPANCPWCFQVFTSLTLLQRHIKTHVGNYKPYSCTYCPASFARSAHLKRHIRTHTGEKPFVCAICDKAFSRQDKLKSHLERHLQTQNQGNSFGGSNARPNMIRSNQQSKSQDTVVTRPSTSSLTIPNGFCQPASSIYQSMVNNNQGNRSWFSESVDRHSKPIPEKQLTISTPAISPSTTITPIGGVGSIPSDANYVHHRLSSQVKIL